MDINEKIQESVRLYREAQKNLEALIAVDQGSYISEKATDAMNRLSEAIPDIRSIERFLGRVAA